MGEGVEFFTVNLPKSFAGKTLADSRIVSLTGLIVLAGRTDDETFADLLSSTVLPTSSRLNVLGTAEQMWKFKEISGRYCSADKPVLTIYKKK
jgi:Trk K+ transport system NAD-binding subunit